MDDIEFFKKDISEIPPDQIIHYGMPFIVGVIGNEISVCKLTRRKFNVDGRLLNLKFDRTVIEDCDSVFGFRLQSYYIIPSQFIVHKAL